MTDARNTAVSDSPTCWPALPLSAWQETRDTLHMWTQMVGKTRLALAPPQNHWWHVALYVTARGLTSSPIPAGTRTFEIDFDFIDHRLIVKTSEGAIRDIALRPQIVADFYREYMALLASLGIAVKLWPVPVEVDHTIPFPEDRTHAAYDAGHAHRFHQMMLHADRVLKRFAGRFLGKSSPVHFFWGGFDLAVTRFSGRPAPLYSGIAPAVHPHVMHEAYSHEVISHGLWFGSEQLPEVVFYGYAVPQPLGGPAPSAGFALPGCAGRRG